MSARALLLGLALALPPVAAPAQEAAPFDMSRERGTPPAGEDAGAATVATRPEEQAAATGLPGRHYIIPARSLLLEGETASRSFPVYLTQHQATAAQSIGLGYSNAIVVAPEASKLTVLVNGTVVGDLPVRSPDGVTDIRFDLPAGLLRPGMNRVTFTAQHRHRTDCTIRSTYDLWTALDPARTFLAVPPGDGGSPPMIDDIAAVGLDPAGRTRFVLVAPEMDQPASTSTLMRLSQGLALLAKMPNQSFEVTNRLPAATGPGEMTVVLGTAGGLSALLPALPAAAASGSVSTFVDAPAGGGKLLLLSGPDWSAVDAAVESVVSPTERSLALTRQALSVHRRDAEDVPLVAGEATLAFSALGVRTSEFSGRRFQTGFDIGIPSDFYADAYGEATLLLDAAYSPEVLPGSHIDIYVNGNIASTVPIASRNGGIFRHLPIRVTMRHFRPGPNRIDIEAILMIEADAVCAPGASAREEPRFALFDTSEFQMPRFARIARLPDLAALAGTGFPYSRQEDPVALYLDRLDGDTLSAGATFLGKLAVSAGRTLRVSPEASALSIGERNAVLIGAISQLPQPVLAQAHLSGESASTWHAPAPSGETRRTAEDGNAMQEWQSRIRGGVWRRWLSALEDWLQETFDISLSSLRLLPGSDMMVTPPETARFLVAQGDSPGGTATWTVLAAPTGADLRAGMETIAGDERWHEIGGYLSLETKDVDALDVREAAEVRFVPTQPLSFGNLRLIAANWMSSNILSYAAAFCALAVLLGMATSGLLRRFGRQD
ncbi:cellulose biosynthesis cyclic di-GMP-binding regulatory protein BcsB [Shinella pollutisoli]|uniref:Cyclic di-GMP-binding protein n=1 Tax=Shinella pollutisoli TaxID=2250594 RepID=A0ABV7DIL7_9HYPH|nr:cellulose biosynthesis cyclic di-GMP-binding regulatory protein BcsB [Shinella pollutisoli]